MVGTCAVPRPAVLTPLGGQSWCLQLGAGCLSRPRAHIEGDSNGITNLGRFKESENILALAGLWELSRFPLWNSHLLFPHIWPQGGKGLGGREARVGMRGEPGTGQEPEWGSRAQEKANRHPDVYADGNSFPPHLYGWRSLRGEPTAHMAGQAQTAQGRSGFEPKSLPQSPGMHHPCCLPEAERG